MIILQQLLNTHMPQLSNKKVKMARHADGRTSFNFKNLEKDREKLLEYQKQQAKEVFKDCEYIISFIAMENTKALLFGVYEVKGIIKGEDNFFYYDLQEVENLQDFYGRVVIEWGKAATAWHQWYQGNEKEVLEILPKGWVGEFPGYQELALDCFALNKILNNPSANKLWIEKLSVVKGIYLILDKKSGKQYIGSAYNSDGIWGRWKDYATTKHGRNVELARMIQEDENCYKDFVFSILQTLPSNITNQQVVEYENIYKEKLGSRAYGLNRN